MTRPIIPAPAKPKGQRLGASMKGRWTEQGPATLRGVATDAIACAGLFLAIYAAMFVAMAVQP